MYVIWGIHPVEERLKNSPDLVDRIVLRRGLKGKERDNILRLAGIRAIPIDFQDEKMLAEAAGHSKHQGIVAFLQETGARILEDILSNPSPSSYGLVLALDGIVDPQNLGSLIRSGHAAGIQGIVLPRHRAARITGTVEKTSAGALSYVPVVTETNLVSAIEALKAAGYWIVGAAPEAKQTIYESDFRTNIALVIGSESKGIRPLVKRHCDFLVSVPMYGEVSSLNAAIAGAIILFEIARQRCSGHADR
ncbi:MAG: 23S rRNA (guanosine(2251)-2'-O)-methyltransferase RlmB [Pseudomonadota bacterium]